MNLHTPTQGTIKVSKYMVGWERKREGRKRFVPYGERWIGRGHEEPDDVGCLLATRDMVSSRIGL